MLNALAGDGAARSWLAKYLIGDHPSRPAPTSINDITGAASDEPEGKDKTLQVEVRSAISNQRRKKLLLGPM